MAVLPRALDEHVHLGKTPPGRLHQVELEILERAPQTVLHLRRRFPRGLHQGDGTHERRINRLQELGNDTAATAAL
jgi:hypothetical protein